MSTIQKIGIFFGVAEAIVIGGAALMLVALIGLSVDSPSALGTALVWGIAFSSFLVPLGAAWAIAQEDGATQIFGVLGLLIIPISLFNVYG